jgi:electron-transferring-flavoprotein dehydrogenase
MGAQAEALGVEIYPGFAAQEVLIEDDIVRGVQIGDMGIGREGEALSGYTPGIELRAKYTLFAEGCRGHLGKRLLKHYQLDKNADPQHYAIGLKEVWQIDPAKHTPGLVIHGAGWPLNDANPGGSFLYHFDQNLVAVGLIVDLSYTNPYLSPFDEFQRFKHHPVVMPYLEGGTRLSYGARAICKGGYNSLPKMVFPGGALIGCDLGTLNFAKIKGSHTAMKSGMVCAEALFEALGAAEGRIGALDAYPEKLKASWVWEELHRVRNIRPAFANGLWVGLAHAAIDTYIFRGKAPWTFRHHADNESLRPAAASTPIAYPRPDGKVSFDRLSSVFLSATNHEENQPAHLTLKDAGVPVKVNLAVYDAPEQRYCPAGVYEIVDAAANPRLQINAQNCVHCKTCDIKDPTQNIVWTVPEGGGGPNYPNM